MQPINTSPIIDPRYYEDSVKYDTDKRIKEDNAKVRVESTDAKVQNKSDIVSIDPQAVRGTRVDELFFSGLHKNGNVTLEEMKEFLQQRFRMSLEVVVKEGRTTGDDEAFNIRLFNASFAASVRANVFGAGLAQGDEAIQIARRDWDGTFSYFNARFYFQAHEFLPIIKEAARAVAEEKGFPDPVPAAMASSPHLFDTSTMLRDRLGGPYMNFPENFTPDRNLSIFQDRRYGIAIINDRPVSLIEAGRRRVDSSLNEWLKSMWIDPDHFDLIGFNSNQVRPSAEARNRSYVQQNTELAYDKYSAFE